MRDAKMNTLKRKELHMRKQKGTTRVIKAQRMTEAFESETYAVMSSNALLWDIIFWH